VTAHRSAFGVCPIQVQGWVRSDLPGADLASPGPTRMRVATNHKSPEMGLSRGGEERSPQSFTGDRPLMFGAQAGCLEGAGSRRTPECNLRSLQKHRAAI